MQNPLKPGVLDLKDGSQGQGHEQYMWGRCETFQAEITFKLLTLRRLMSYIYIYIYIYMEHLFLMFLDHTERRSTVGRTPLDE